MKIRNRLILIYGVLFFLLLFFEFFFGANYFESYFRYKKGKELEKIDFIVNNQLNIPKLKEYQENKRAFALIIKNDKIENLENFNYFLVKENNEEKVVLLDAFLDDLNLYNKLEEYNGEVVKLKVLEIMKNYYIPFSMEINGKKYINQKYETKEYPTKEITGEIKELHNSYEFLTQSDDLLEILMEKDATSLKSGNYSDLDGDDEYRIYQTWIKDYKIVIYYSYENLNDVFSTIENYFYIKGLIFILFLLIIGRILDNKLVKPIIELSKITKEIGKLNFKNVVFSKSNDEIGTLYRSIIQMSKNLEGVIKLYKEESAKNKENKLELENHIKYFMHEVKTPLSAIIGFSELLLEKNNSEELEIINSEGKRLLKLANELIERESSTDTMKFNYSNFDLVDTVEMIKKIYEKELSHKKFSFEYLGEYKIYADKGKIEQVLLNLVKNAIDYSVNEIKIQLRNVDDKIEVSIENDFDLNENIDCKKIWYKYYSKNGENRGLGLYIVSEILKKHNFSYNTLIENNKIKISFLCNSNKAK